MNPYAVYHTEDKKGPNSECTQKDWTVNQVVVDADVNKQLSQLNLNTAEKKQTYFNSKVTFWEAPTAKLMYGNKNVFKNLSIQYDKLEKEKYQRI